MPAHESSAPCRSLLHRAIPLRFPYVHAKVIHARLITEMGADRVSKQLREIEGGWEVIICDACVIRDAERSDGTGAVAVGEPMDAEARCGICAQPIKPGEKAMFKNLPDKGIVRVHVLCCIKARIHRVNRRSQT